MIRHGDPPFLECSSRGDRRFSAFSARIRRRGNRSVEEIYQAAKRFSDGSTGLTWREAKGRKAINQEECAALYGRLWDEYIAENPHLISVLRSATGLSDLFGQPGHCCQATELWRIRGPRVTTVVRMGEPDSVYIGRPSKWGNPFVVGRDGGRGELIERYRTYLMLRPDLLDSLGELRGRKLACHCAPSPCHGDVLAELADCEFMRLLYP